MSAKRFFSPSSFTAGLATPVLLQAAEARPPKKNKLGASKNRSPEKAAKPAVGIKKQTAVSPSERKKPPTDAPFSATLLVTAIMTVLFALWLRLRGEPKPAVRPKATEKKRWPRREENGGKGENGDGLRFGEEAGDDIPPPPIFISDPVPTPTPNVKRRPPRQSRRFRPRGAEDSFDATDRRRFPPSEPPFGPPLTPPPPPAPSSDSSRRRRGL